jgi:hypothetical protein
MEKSAFFSIFQSFKMAIEQILKAVFDYLVVEILNLTRTLNVFCKLNYFFNNKFLFPIIYPALATGNARWQCRIYLSLFLKFNYKLNNYDSERIQSLSKCHNERFQAYGT